jgi:hypothetical protein
MEVVFGRLWMRELKIKVEDSHLLMYYVEHLFKPVKSKAQSKLKKKQEQELQKRTAEGQPRGAPAAKREKQTR